MSLRSSEQGEIFTAIEVEQARERANANRGECGWPPPTPLADELPRVQEFVLDLLPSSFRPLVEDVSDRMQTPPDYAAAASVVALAGCVNRRALIRPKAEDSSWLVTPNLWGTNVAPPGFMKSPILRAITGPLARIEEVWHATHAQESSEYYAAKEEADLQLQAWRENVKRAFKRGETIPTQPDNSLKPPLQRRLVLTDSTFEKLHEILRENPAGVLVIRDELTGWLAELDRPGREGERAFFLQAWNGDTGFTIDRIGRGSIYVPEVCISLFGNIQPSRLRWYLSESLGGGPSDDGLFQRFQISVWPDPPKCWKLVDRPPNVQALGMTERVYDALANLSADDPVRMRFDPEAQQLFFGWLAELEGKVRGDSGLAPPIVGHLAKYRSLMPSLAAIFELADIVAAGGNFHHETSVNLEHARQAAAFCDYLESHAQRIYSCVASPDWRAARDLVRHINRGDLQAIFTTREVYLKGWSGLDSPDRVRRALGLLEDGAWVRRAESPSPSTGGRPSEIWLVNPMAARREK
jgi:hypothetical protein